MEQNHPRFSYIKFGYNGKTQEVVVANKMKIIECFKCVKEESGWIGSTKNASFYINGELVSPFGSISYYYEELKRSGFIIGVQKRMSFLDTVLRIRKFFNSEEMRKISEMLASEAKAKAKKEEEILITNDEIEAEENYQTI